MVSNYSSISTHLIITCWFYIGILPRDGKNISFKELNAKIRTTYNFAPTFCFFVPNKAANFLNKNYGKDTFDLADLDLHNGPGIEHDASLTRKFLFEYLYNRSDLSDDS